jgi:hypothetical protein
VLSVTIARRLRDAGLSWTPQRGDRFVVADRDMDDEVFVLSDMTIEVHRYPGGPVIGFNGTTEWALDSVDQQDALWMPLEHQLRELLGGCHWNISCASCWARLLSDWRSTTALTGWCSPWRASRKRSSRRVSRMPTDLPFLLD